MFIPPRLTKIFINLMGHRLHVFLHPLSHELDFMNLDKVFDSQEYIGDYFFQGFQVDKLSIFLYEIRTNKLRFKQVTNVKFHFFPIEKLVHGNQ